MRRVHTRLVGRSSKGGVARQRDLRATQRAGIAVVGLVSTAVTLTPSAAAAAPAPTFSDPQQFRAGIGPWFLTATRLNDDRRADLAVANSASSPGKVSLLVNRTRRESTTARFEPAGVLHTDGPSAQALAAADFNRDGRRDLAVGSFFTSDTLPLPGIGIGLFANRTPAGARQPRMVAAGSIRGGTGPESLAAADFNRDGRRDLAFTNYGVPGLAVTQDVSVALNRTPRQSPTIRFSPRTAYRVGTQPLGVVVADVNRDRRPDLVVSNNFSYSVSVLLNRTAKGAAEPRFAAPVDFGAGSPPIGPETLAAGDLNDDGRADIVTPNFLTGQLGDVSVLFNTTARGAASPSFAAASTYRAGVGPQHIAIGDLNGDDVPDVAVANYGAVGVPGSAGVSVLVNHTRAGARHPRLEAAVDLHAGAGPTSLAARDFNRDGRLDLAVSNNLSLGAAGLSVLLNATRF